MDAGGGSLPRDTKSQAPPSVASSRGASEMADSQAAPHTFADRETGTSYATAFEMLNAYLARFATDAGVTPTWLDATGYAQVKRGGANVGVNVLDEDGVLLILAPIATVPTEGREAFYRRLLELSFLATADAAFAIDGANDVVYVRALRRISGLDYEE